MSDELGRSWAAFTGEDPDGIEPTTVAIMCPVCAAREFEWRPVRVGLPLNLATGADVIRAKSRQQSLR